MFSLHPIRPVRGSTLAPAHQLNAIEIDGDTVVSPTGFEGKARVIASRPSQDDVTSTDRDLYLLPDHFTPTA
jgi:hypothetical protein